MPLPPSHAPWTALVVEDEPRLRAGLVDLLRESSQAWAGIREAADGETALALCREAAPTVAFVDIRLPGLSGMEVAARMPPSTRVIFATAYDSHAMEAFDTGAVDYLLKPVTAERLEKTLARLRAQESLPLEALRAWIAAAAPPPAAPEPLRWITATSGKRTRWIPAEEARYFQAGDKVTKVVCAEGEYLVDTPIKVLAARLDPALFQQVHRAVIVNLRAVAWLERGPGEGGELHLRNPEACLPVSAPFMAILKQRFQGGDLLQR